MKKLFKGIEAETLEELERKTNEFVESNVVQNVLDLRSHYSTSLNKWFMNVVYEPTPTDINGRFGRVPERQRFEQ